MKSWMIMIMLICLPVSVQGCVPANVSSSDVVDHPQNVPSISGTVQASSTTTIGGPTNEPETEASKQTPTQVPRGLFLLMSYPPLSLDYDPSLWIDKSDYSNADQLVNYLQSISLNSCTLGPSGPSGFYPTPDHTVNLSGIQYDVVQVPTEQGNSIMYYFEGTLIKGYDRNIGVPVLNVTANKTELPDCIQLAEEVLSTLCAQ